MHTHATIVKSRPPCCCCCCCCCYLLPAACYTRLTPTPPPALHALTSFSSFPEICDAAALARARCRPLPPPNSTHAATAIYCACLSTTAPNPAPPPPSHCAQQPTVTGSSSLGLAGTCSCSTLNTLYGANSNSCCPVQPKCVAVHKVDTACTSTRRRPAPAPPSPPSTSLQSSPPQTCCTRTRTPQPR